MSRVSGLESTVGHPDTLDTYFVGCPANTSARVGDTVSFLAKWAGPPKQDMSVVERAEAAPPIADDTASKTLTGDGPLVPVSETRFEEAVQSTAVDILNREGVRRFALDGVTTLGIWKAADTPEVRAAIATLYPGRTQVVRLEDERVPKRYRTRQPAHLRTLEDTPPDAPRISWAEWKASMLNRLFEEQGVTGKPSRITAATVRHGTQRKSDWLDWTPEGQISGASPRNEPTKPSKPGFVGFVGATSANTTEIQPPSAPASTRQPEQNPTEVHPAAALKGYAVCLCSDLVGGESVDRGRRRGR